MPRDTLPNLIVGGNAGSYQQSEVSYQKYGVESDTLLNRMLDAYGLDFEHEKSSRTDRIVVGPMNTVLLFVEPRQRCALAGASRIWHTVIEHDAASALPYAANELKNALSEPISNAQVPNDKYKTRAERILNRLRLGMHTSPAMSKRRLLLQTRLRTLCWDSWRRWLGEKAEVQRARTKSLTLAVKDSDMERIRRLIRLGGDLWAGNYEGKTAIFTAFEQHNYRLMRWLHCAGVPLPPILPTCVHESVGLPEQSICLDMWAACLLDDIDLARCLLEDGSADAISDIYPHLYENPILNIQDKQKRESGECRAASNLRYTRPRPPIHFARSIAMCKLFGAHGASIHALDSVGTTAIASMCGNRSILGVVSTDVLHFIESLGGDMSQPNCHGETCLHAAAAAGNLEALRFILRSKCNVDVNALDENGQTPLLLACSRDRGKVAMMGAMTGKDANEFAVTDIVRLLVEHGADVNTADQDGRSPLGEARWQQNTALVVFLSAHGATELDMKKRFEWEVEAKEPIVPGQRHRRNLMDSPSLPRLAVATTLMERRARSSSVQANSDGRMEVAQEGT